MRSLSTDPAARGCKHATTSNEPRPCNLAWSSIRSTAAAPQPGAMQLRLAARGNTASATATATATASASTTSRRATPRHPPKPHAPSSDVWGSPAPAISPTQLAEELSRYAAACAAAGIGSSTTTGSSSSNSSSSRGRGSSSGVDGDSFVAACLEGLAAPHRLSRLRPSQLAAVLQALAALGGGGGGGGGLEEFLADVDAACYCHPGPFSPASVTSVMQSLARLHASSSSTSTTSSSTSSTTSSTTSSSTSSSTSTSSTTSSSTTSTTSSSTSSTTSSSTTSTTSSSTTSTTSSSTSSSASGGVPMAAVAAEAAAGAAAASSNTSSSSSPSATGSSRGRVPPPRTPSYYSHRQAAPRRAPAYLPPRSSPSRPSRPSPSATGSFPPSPASRSRSSSPDQRLARAPTPAATAAAPAAEPAPYRFPHAVRLRLLQPGGAARYSYSQLAALLQAFRCLGHPVDEAVAGVVGGAMAEQLLRMGPAERAAALEAVLGAAPPCGCSEEEEACGVP